MSFYPGAEWVPWKYQGPMKVSYFKGLNRPKAVVLHVMAGYLRTSRAWAISGYDDASWHYSIGRDGTVLQHLRHEDGGYHAGVVNRPTWNLYTGTNPNLYTIGIEHEGFPREPFTEPQSRASRDLCRWLSRTLNIPMDREHFPPHAVIDTINRPNDFNTPALREEFYRYLFEEEDEMTPEQAQKLEAVWRALCAGQPEILDAWNANGNSLLKGYELEQGEQDGLLARLTALEGRTLPEGTYRITPV